MMLPDCVSTKVINVYEKVYYVLLTVRIDAVNALISCRSSYWIKALIKEYFY